MAIEFIVLALATWRLTSLLVWEEGPLDVFARLRHLLGVRYDQRNQPYGSNWFAKGVVCPACASVWFGFLWAGAYLLWKPAWMVALPFALSTCAVAIEKWVADA